MDSRTSIPPSRALRRFAAYLAVTLSLAVASHLAAAESQPGKIRPPAFSTGKSALDTANCSQARDVSRCLALQKAREGCAAQRGGAKRRCLRENLPAPSCDQAPDPGRCVARQQARLACQGKPGKALRKCLRDYAAGSPPPISSIN